MSRLSIRQVTKVFQGTARGASPTTALQPTSLEVADNDFITVLGPSGCGKSTLLRLVAGLETPTGGEILLDGHRVEGPGADRGVVFQSYTLFPWLNVRQNICFGLREKGVPEAQQKEISEYFIASVGLRGFEQHFPKQLSGGMQQRVAIARALAKNPKLLLCDEPTGALDYVTGKNILKLLQDTCRKKGVTVVVITHNQAITAMADRIITVKNGTVTDMRKNEHIVPVEQIEW